jgi:hypothetical protein
MKDEVNTETISSSILTGFSKELITLLEERGEGTAYSSSCGDTRGIFMSLKSPIPFYMFLIETSL